MLVGLIKVCAELADLHVGQCKKWVWDWTRSVAPKQTQMAGQKEEDNCKKGKMAEEKKPGYGLVKWQNCFNQMVKLKRQNLRGKPKEKKIERKNLSNIN